MKLGARVIVVTALLVIAISTTAAATTKDPPTTTPTTTNALAPARLRVLVVGESQAGTLAAGSPKGQGPHGLVARSDLVLWDSTILGCSISSAPTFILATGDQAPNQCGGTGAWQERWTADVAATKPDVVFLMAGARDLFDVAGADGTVVHPGDPAWTQAYVADVEHLFRILGATGAPIVAVKPTCYGQNTLPDAEGQASERLDPVRVRAVTAAWQTAARAVGQRLLDLDAVTCPGGMADPVIRADGVHFTAAGADQLASKVDAALHAAARRARKLKR